MNFFDCPRSLDRGHHFATFDDFYSSERHLNFFLKMNALPPSPWWWAYFPSSLTFYGKTEMRLGALNLNDWIREKKSRVVIWQKIFPQFLKRTAITFDFRFRLQDLSKIFPAQFIFMSNHNNQFVSPIKLTTKNMEFLKNYFSPSKQILKVFQNPWSGEEIKKNFVPYFDIL